MGLERYMRQCGCANDTWRSRRRRVTAVRWAARWPVEAIRRGTWGITRHHVAAHEAARGGTWRPVGLGDLWRSGAVHGGPWRPVRVAREKSTWQHGGTGRHRHRTTTPHPPRLNWHNF